eukprot:TRINITY_DN2149_c0_g1_i10.p1 TRINITY_DN2149_c0_g1~~TRINITY_DN2149_c0_g1_i10.p1  ORF type:complete len:287 (+),score=46.00 TRINITY_DN2149_c0_g1_i10:291-1151(+)
MRYGNPSRSLVKRSSGINAEYGSLLNYMEGFYIVTGGVSGLGEETSRVLFQSGACVSLFDRDDKKGEELVQRWNKMKTANPTFGEVFFIKVDVTSEVDVKNAIRESLKKFGENLRGVINCAGIAYAQKVFTTSRGPHALETFQRVLNINLTGTFNVARLAAEQMAKQKPYNEDGERGIIINVASVAAFEGQQGQVAYSASKGGIVSMTVPMARDLSQYGIRVMCIAPGIMETPMTKGMPKNTQEALIKDVCFPHRFGTAQEFAAMVLALVRNTFMNGYVEMRTLNY